ncbi:MAG: hypothetical protein LCH91_12725 [Bacteroidetes bacterium]|nr:hypothetical protein [Bacteroidota bacterium]
MAILKCFIAGRVSSWSEELANVTDSNCTTIYYLLTDDFSTSINKDSYFPLQIPVESIKLIPTDKSITIESTDGKISTQFLVFEAEIIDNIDVYFIAKNKISDVIEPQTVIIEDIINNTNQLTEYIDNETLILFATPSRPPDPNCY